METNFSTKTLYTNDCVFENSFDEAVECDVTLPDYCPDIKKILKCSLSPRLVSSRCSGENVNIEANAAVRVIYASDDNRVFCYEKTIPFSKTVDIGKQIENPCVKVNLRTAYANVRAVSARKLEVRSSVGINVVVTAKHEHKVVCDAENGGIQLLKNCSGAGSFVGETVKTFNLSETVEIGDGRAPILQILRVSSEIFDPETKFVNNKALLKGNLKVNILYISDDEERRPQVFIHTMPVSQIIDLDGISDKTDNFCFLSTNGVDVGVKTNASGERRLADIDAGMIVLLNSSQKIEEALPTDCFSTKYDSQAAFKNIRLKNTIERICDRLAVKSTEKINGVKIDEIYDVWCDKIKTSARLSDGEVKVSGEAVVSLLGKDESGAPFYVERNISLDKTIPAKTEDDSCNVLTDVGAVDVSFILGGEDTVEIRFDATICVDIVESKDVKLISEIKIDENSRKQPSPSFTVYFADPGETLWDIARRFNTTIDDISQENDSSALNSDERRMLFIPTI
ncbi:MAG: DUF3794 domain-containing protein [Clostridia bacterium]|nr:DUF3794 domain-containing protein [Clostridia bacterium]